MWWDGRVGMGAVLLHAYDTIDPTPPHPLTPHEKRRFPKWVARFRNSQDSETGRQIQNSQGQIQKPTMPDSDLG